MAAVLWYLIVSTRKDVASLQKEVNLMKYNYLSRFDDIKDILKSFELNVIQRISILETLINKKG